MRWLTLSSRTVRDALRSALLSQNQSSVMRENANEPTWSMSTGIFWLKTTLTFKDANMLLPFFSKTISTLYWIALALARKPLPTPIPCQRRHLFTQKNGDSRTERTCPAPILKVLRHLSDSDSCQCEQRTQIPGRSISHVDAINYRVYCRHSQSLTSTKLNIFNIHSQQITSCRGETSKGAYAPN